MNEQHKYRATDKMSDLICDNYSLLMVMSRFGLSLGFGDKSVKDVCEAQNVDYRTFLAVANFSAKSNTLTVRMMTHSLFRRLWII